MMDGWARVGGRTVWAASWARTGRAMGAARRVFVSSSRIWASGDRDDDKERKMPMRDLGCFDCGWWWWLMLMMLMMERWVMAVQWVG